MARKILLADDSVTAQNMGRRILSDAGYDVTTVNNGSAALKKIAESKPDLIVLDVYMPGYGGLEVCQRLREAPETARIPVLLTVGKLEPFKADEARRVRADAFIVKPFEASELLTALTKLEDKIVPQGQPSRQSRFAKALAGVEELNPSNEFGNSETGWKNRLSIPPPQSKHREAPPEETSAVVASLREAVKTEEPKPAEMKSGLEEALLSSMPQDITPEEIAAIKAAAAALNTPGNESTSKMRRRSTDRVEVPIQEPVAKAEELTSESVVSEVTPATAQGESSEAAVENNTTAESRSPGDVPTEIVVPAQAIVSASDSFQISAQTGKLGDEEVTAALASLAPANGHAAEHREREADKWERESRELVPVTMAVAGATQEFSGPRWIAEPVPLRDDEATLILEQEMEKAYAAFAAADAAGMSFANSPALESFSPIAEAPTTASEMPPSQVESSSNFGSSESNPQEPTAEAAATSREESLVPQVEGAPVVAPPVVDAVSESTVAEISESAAYAAAASASPTSVEATIAADATAAPSPALVSSENAPVTSEPGERQGESELAAAWANWKQIRESVIGSQIDSSQLSSQIADAVAAPKEDIAEAKPDSQPEDLHSTGEETTEIANIVDSVLADLKPKLMAEIAKKMGKEKKK
ncbi:MAG TPA: response regulator [Verrucomicrobiae bacterium]|nr:response regulator [Verrucomicrobiae bacterium]